MIRQLTKFTVLLLLVAVTKCLYLGPGLKSGRCPSTTGMMGVCVEECEGDDGCPGNSKCCSTGCGRVCRAPRGEAHIQQITPRKAGTCPAVDQDVVATCQEDCSSDDDCRGFAKCCSNGCGHTCQHPVEDAFIQRARPGTCPPFRFQDQAGVCVDQCSEDAECGVGNRKCCFNGCGHTCETPAEDLLIQDRKEGLCPSRINSDGFASCEEECTVDSDCWGRDKCCSNGCGHTCQLPRDPRGGIRGYKRRLH